MKLQAMIKRLKINIRQFKIKKRIDKSNFSVFKFLILIGLTLLIILPNCNIKNTNRLLAGNKQKFWDELDPNLTNVKRTGYLFTADYNCYYYTYATDSNRYKFEFGDNYCEETWKYLAGNSIIMMGDTVEIKSISEDTLKIIEYGKFERVYTKSFDQNFEHFYKIKFK